MKPWNATPTEIAAGRQRGWSLVQKLGEGDAGEVYRVESLLDRQVAILKRPRRGGFPSEGIRQATQIEQEGRILSALAALDHPAVDTPTLLDESRSGSGYSEQYFIVISPAPGASLSALVRAARFGGPADAADEHRDPAEQRLLEISAARGQIPDLLLLRALAGWIDFIESVHILKCETPTGLAGGIIWNDVKPEHFFWDPARARLTVIDWGNARYLEADGVTKDRRHSRFSDYAQFMEEMGRFLQDAAPQLRQRLEWPQDLAPGSVYSAGLLPLQERIRSLLEEELLGLRRIRRQEADLLGSASLRFEQVDELTAIQQQILALGETPDDAGAQQFLLRLARQLVSDGHLEQFNQVCQAAGRLPAVSGERCHLLQTLSQTVLDNDLPPAALLAGLGGEWAEALWALRQAINGPGVPGWWEAICDQIRRIEIGPQAVAPLVAFNRLLHALQALALNAAPPAEGEAPPPYAAVLGRLRQDLQPRWTQEEPDPPDSGIEYRELERSLEQLSAWLPDAGGLLVRSLEQPRLQARISLDAWERRDFELARRGLRRLLLWDPDRLRVLQADRAIQMAPGWLEEVRRGLTRDEPLSDWIARMELTGRDLRNQVGPAVWLDGLLEAFRQLRKDLDPTDVLVQHPEIREDLGWLIAMEPRRPLLASPGRQIRLERAPAPLAEKPTLFGLKESPLGSPKGLLLDAPLDTWTPEARGSSARLFYGRLPALAGELRPAAVKLMRPDRLEYALPLFREEAAVLSLLRDVPGVTPLLEYGFIRLSNDGLPAEEQALPAGHLTGTVQRYGLDSIHNFLADLDSRANQGWIPYLALELRDNTENLLLQCDPGFTQGRFLPVLDGLCMAIQICDILSTAHARNIIYRDHKILHYYWVEAYNGIFTVDWNIARRYPGGLSSADIQFDLVQFGARALHYILTGRPAPGALPMGPNRPEEIEAAARSYTARWTYDDQRLPADIKALLEGVLAGQYNDAAGLRADLHSIYLKLFELTKG